MGYLMYKSDANFKMKGARLPEALQALKAVAGGGEQWDWVTMRVVGDASTFEDAMRECRWDLDLDADGDVVGIDFVGEKLGDDEQAFSAIAPWVKHGSFIEMVGEDGDRWRWVFEDDAVKWVDPEISW